MGEMSTVKERIDQIDKTVFESLAPFQQATVEHIDWLYRKDKDGGEKGIKRILVADEVGLGKTRVARGVVSKIAKLRRDEDDTLVKVAYICSNVSIAEQNLRRLSIDRQVKPASAENARLSMQHLNLAEEALDPELKDSYVQLIPLTPGTSFHLNTGVGTLAERALMYNVLIYDELFCGSDKRKRRTGLKNLLWAWKKTFNKASWDWYLSNYKERVNKAFGARVFEGSELSYPYDVLEKVRAELLKDGNPLEGIAARIDEDRAAGVSARTIDVKYRDSVIAALRRAFAKASMDMMQPDFVIMDEFQRFRELISFDADNETSVLAQRFFSDNVRVLLLSATPFKLYSTSAELDDGGFEDSYQEFMQIMDFLSEDDAEARKEFREVWSDYSHALLSINNGDDSAVVLCCQKKLHAEEVASTYLARTERLSTGELTEMMDGSSHNASLQPRVEDEIAHFAIAQLLSDVNVPKRLFATDFSKSCPFPLSYMRPRQYVAADKLAQAAVDKWDSVERTAGRYSRYLWVNDQKIAEYKKLSIPHARYRAFETDVLDERDSDGNYIHPEQLLWVPASRPYYLVGASSPYAHAAHFSKYLVFSSWGMVPPAVATLMSYEATRRNIEKLEQRTGDSYLYSRADDDVDDDSEGQLDGRTVPYHRLLMTGRGANSFCIVYPSRYLGTLGREVLRDGSLMEASGLPSLADLSARIKRKLRTDLERVLGIRLTEDGSIGDIAWYAYAELILDDYYYNGAGQEFIRSIIDTCAEKGLYLAACTTMHRYLENYEPGEWKDRIARIPGDLLDVLVDAALGSPAVCALRCYEEFLPSDEEADPYLAFEFGYAFMTKMNTASATSVIEVCMGKGNLADSAAAHWKHVLAYCCEGNFQAMLDEYAHLQYDDTEDYLDGRLRVESMHNAMVGGVYGRDRAPSFYKADSVYLVRTYSKFKEEAGGRKRRASELRMRTNFAVAFMEDEQSAKRKMGNRRTLIRNAFNSPFRPFVLVSTSIGQEGLDFHRYCRRVVHWNLPSNPIDFEQREGRINRYAGLAVRQTIADRYGWDDASPYAGNGRVWERIFKNADKIENDRATISNSNVRSGLLPFWGVTEGDDVTKIERYIYSYPFSKDERLYRYLLATIVRYRAVFGQPNQEALLTMLEENSKSTRLLGENFEKLFINLCPFVKDAERQSSGDD